MNKIFDEEILLQDPFDPEFDPGCVGLEGIQSEEKPEPDPEHQCDCDHQRTFELSRRQVLVGMSTVAAASPALASTATNLIPCQPTKQQKHSCRHKFCRFYYGFGDYYGR